MAGNEFKHRLRLDPKKAIHLGNEGDEASTLILKIVEVLFLLFALGGLQALLQGFRLVGDSVIIHDMHVVNTVCPLSPNIPDQQPLSPPAPPHLAAVTP